MNKNLVLISYIGLFLADVHNPLSNLFLASHIVCMRPCKTLGMEEWLLRPAYYFATSVDEAKSICSVLGYDNHFQNSGTILLRYYIILFWYCRIAFIRYCKQCLPLRSYDTVGKNFAFIWYCGRGSAFIRYCKQCLPLRSYDTVGKNFAFIWYCGRGSAFIRYCGKKFAFIRYYGRRFAFIWYWAKIGIHSVL
jgi:hypothetical protein